MTLHRLAIALRTLGLAASLAAGAALAEPATSAIPGVLAAGTPVQLIQEGFKGTEGPVALPDGSLIFTETQASRITRIAPDDSVSPFLENSNGSNGLGFNGRGELISVQTVKPQVGVIYPAGRERVLAAAFEGKPLARPNDLVVDRLGGAYFTDPGANPLPGAAAAKPAVYHVSAEGALRRLVEDIERPNGIQLSPDERVLYVANTRGEHVLAYAIGADGNLGPRREFARLAGWSKGDNGDYASGADGLAVDAEGRLYVASNAGIEVFSNAGQALGVIPLPKKPQNLAFAGPDKKTLYVVGRGAAYRIALLTPGYAGRAK
jgi:gluconolactonase